jgi:uncharacterized membrane protein YphA (DoxX/SURF4 family)
MLLALVVLRMAVGCHFFAEGTSKLESGDFTAAPFLRSAHGPLAFFFHGLLDDPNGRWRFCVAPPTPSETNEPAAGKIRLDPEITFALWDDFIDRAAAHYQFGSRKLLQEIAARGTKWEEQLERARASNDSAVDMAKLQQLKEQDAAKLRQIQHQLQRADEILAAHQQQLNDWLEANRAEVIAWCNTNDRVNGFDRDGRSRKLVATQVDSLRQQVVSISAKRQTQFNQWTEQVESIWNSLESEINSLAVDEQQGRSPVRLHRPFDQTWSRQNTIDWLVPRFDAVVGGLLLLGLFTRLAAAMAALFLTSIILSQPPWIAGAAPAQLVFVEWAALIVIAITGASQFGGLDYFLHRLFRKKPTPAG